MPNNPNARPDRPLPPDYEIGGRDKGRPHRLRHVLGQGGFGIAYLALAPDGDQVAIKEFFPNGIAYRSGKESVAIRQGWRGVFDEALRHFMQEAETLRRMPPHHNVVRVRALFGRNNTAYMVMDRIDGDSVSSAIRGMELGRFAPDDAALRAFIQGMGEGLAHVHDRGVLHFDIKPQNILVRRKDASPVLIDFGSSRNFAVERAQPNSFTHAYAPIELIKPSRGEPCGPWTDIFSLGAVAYHLATGKPSIKAEDRDIAIAAGLADPLQSCVEARRTGIGEALASVIDHCLAFEASARPRDARDLLRRLDPPQEPAPPPPVSPAQDVDLLTPINSVRPDDGVLKRFARFLLFAIIMLAAYAYYLFSHAP